MIILAFFIMPIIVTILNTVFLFKNIYKKSLVIITVLFTFFCSTIYILIYYFESSRMIYQFNYFYLFLIGSIALIILSSTKKNLPPIIAIVLMTFVYILNMLTILLAFQIRTNEHFLFNIIYLVPYNCIILTVTVFRKIINRQLDYIEENKIKYTNPFINKCYIFLYNSENWRFISFVLLMALFITNIAIYIITLFGQGDKSNLNNLLDVNESLMIKGTMITPEPDPGGASYNHYLCTVALKGDKKIVKPLRYGYRYNRKIIVNRQLLVANAFEDYIQKNLPNIHKFIRYIYDKYGYPLSKKIKTKKSANITYILMKPLEWFFVLFLYTFDTEPEKRISRQYL